MKKINNYLSKHYFIHAFIATVEYLLAWIMFIIYYSVYYQSIDIEGFKAAYELDNTVQIEAFYSSSSLIYYFIGYLFLAIGIFTSIYFLFRWGRAVILKLREKADE